MSLLKNGKTLSKIRQRNLSRNSGRSTARLRQRSTAISSTDLPKRSHGKLGELAASYDVRPVIFMGFLDGVNSSLENSNDFENFDEESQVEIEDELPEALFYNMLAADADYLYGLPQWETILGEEKITEIAKKYKQSKTVRRAAPKVGRNDPCPCGSGKKYKHCCGRN